MRAPIAVVAILAAAPIAHADDEIVRGSVVKVEAAEIYVNLGRNRAIEDGSALRIKRTIKLQHPITRAAIEDWVPVGSAVVTQAGERLSRAVVGVLVDQIRVGDVAEVLIDREDRPPPKPAQPPPQEPAGPRIDPTTAEVLATFGAQTGAPLEARIAAWEKYLSTRPTSPYAVQIRTDLDTLVAMREQLQPAKPAGNNTELDIVIAHEGPKRATADRALPLVFVVPHPARVASVYLHYRVASDRTYKRVLLEREHDIYMRGKIPAEAMRAPGVHYFLEVSAPAGTSGLALGTPAQPRSIEVIERSVVLDRFAPRAGKSSVRITGELLDFATFDSRPGDRTDRMAVANVDFTYRIDRFVESVGVGYGVFAGQGGFANTDFTGMEVPRSAFQFGYADVECGMTEKRVHVSVGARLIAGVGRDGFGLGGEGRIRFGHRDAANLVLAASTIQQVGSLADIRFMARPVSDLKVTVSVGATDQPNRGDIGVKLGSELEYTASPHVSLLLRSSWQGRTTEHGGIGGGAGVGFTW